MENGNDLALVICMQDVAQDVITHLSLFFQLWILKHKWLLS